MKSKGTIEADRNSDAPAPEAERDAHELIGMGLAIGALGATAGVVAGTVCPVCIVATPALVGLGVFKKLRARRQNRRSTRRSRPA